MAAGGPGSAREGARVVSGARVLFHRATRCKLRATASMSSQCDRYPWRALTTSSMWRATSGSASCIAIASDRSVPFTPESLSSSFWQKQSLIGLGFRSIE